MTARRQVEPIAGSRTSVDKALEILEAFGGVGTSLSLTQVVESTGLPKATAHRLLATLIAHALVERDGNRYTLGTRMFTLGNQVSFCRPRRLRAVANPYLCALREKTGQTVKLGVLTNSEVVLVERLGVRGESSPAAIGARLPAHCTALGRVLMAYEPRDEVALNLRKPLEPRTPRTATDPELIMDELRHTRVNGFAVEQHESIVGLSCIAVPVFTSRSKRPVAAISVATLGREASPLEFVTSAQMTARAISDSLRADKIA